MTQQKMTIAQLAATSQEQFLALERKMDAGFQDVRSDIKLVLSAIETLSGQMADVRQSAVSALDYARLETRVETLKKKLGIKS
jgi:hypothetical protein